MNKAAIEKETIEELAGQALQARGLAYSPYSDYRVGAALLTAEGDIYTGCNIENAAYAPTNCAERTAFFKAVSEGKRNFRAIAIAGGPAGRPIAQYAWPCGVCRQVMMEFCEPENFVVIVAKSTGEYQVKKLSELLPDGFGPTNLAD